MSTRTISKAQQQQQQQTSSSFTGCGPFQLAALDMWLTVNSLATQQLAKKNNQHHHQYSNNAKTASVRRSERMTRIRITIFGIVALLVLWIILPIDLSFSSSSSSSSMMTVSEFFQQETSSSASLLENFLQDPQVKARFPAFVKIVGGDNRQSISPSNTFLISNCISASTANSVLGTNSSKFAFSPSTSSSYYSLAAPVSEFNINVSVRDKILSSSASTSCSEFSEAFVNGSLFCSTTTGTDDECSAESSAVDTELLQQSKLLYSSSVQYLVLFNQSTSDNITFATSRNKLYESGDNDQLTSYFQTVTASSSSPTFIAFGHDIKEVKESASKNDALIYSAIELYNSNRGTSSSSSKSSSTAFIITEHSLSSVLKNTTDLDKLLGEDSMISFVSVLELSSTSSNKNEVEIFVPSPASSSMSSEDSARAFMKTFSLVLSLLLVVYLILVWFEDDTINNGWSSSTQSTALSLSSSSSKSSSSSSSISLFYLSVPLLIVQVVFISDPSWFFVASPSSSTSSSMTQINPTLTGIFGNNAVRWFDLIFRTWVVPVLALLPFWSNAEKMMSSGGNKDINKNENENNESSSSSPSISELEDQYGKISGKIENYMIIEIFKTHIFDAFKRRGALWFVPLFISFFTFALHVVESLSVAHVKRGDEDPTAMLFRSGSGDGKPAFASSNLDQSDDNEFYYTLIPRGVNDGFPVFYITNFVFQFIVVLGSLLMIIFTENNNSSNDNNNNNKQNVLYNIRSFTTRRFLSIKWGVKIFLVPILIIELFLIFWNDIFVPANLFRIGDRIFLSSTNVAGLASGAQIFHSLFKVAIIILILHPFPQALLDRIVSASGIISSNNDATNEDEDKERDDRGIKKGTHHHNNKIFWRQPSSGFIHQKRIVIGTSIGNIRVAQHSEENVHPLSQAVPSVSVVVCDDEEMFELGTVASSTTTATNKSSNNSSVERNNNNNNNDEHHHQEEKKTTITSMTPHEENMSRNTSSTNTKSKNNNNDKHKNYLSPQQIAALPRPAHTLEFTEVRQPDLIASDASSLILEETVTNAFTVAREAMEKLVSNNDNKPKVLGEHQSLKQSITGNIPFLVSSVKLASSASSSIIDQNDDESSSSSSRDKPYHLKLDQTAEPINKNNNTNSNPLSHQQKAHQTVVETEEKEEKKKSETNSSSSNILLSCFALPEIIELPDPLNKKSDPTNQNFENEDEKKYKKKLEEEARKNATQFMFLFHHHRWSDEEIIVRWSNDWNSSDEAKKKLMIETNIIVPEESTINKTAEMEEKERNDDEASSLPHQVPSAESDQNNNNNNGRKNIDDDEDESRRTSHQKELAQQEERNSSINETQTDQKRKRTINNEYDQLVNSLLNFASLCSDDETTNNKLMAKRRNVKFWFIDMTTSSSSSSSSLQLASVAHDVLSSFSVMTSTATQQQQGDEEDNKNDYDRSSPLELESAVIIDRSSKLESVSSSIFNRAVPDLSRFNKKNGNGNKQSNDGNKSKKQTKTTMMRIPKIFCLKLISSIEHVLVSESESVAPTSSLGTLLVNDTSSSCGDLNQNHHHQVQKSPFVVSVEEVPILILLAPSSSDATNDDNTCLSNIITNPRDLFAVPSDFVLELLGRT